MKIQYCHLIDTKYLDSEIYYVAYLDWQQLEDAENKLALHKKDTERHKLEKEVAMSLDTPYASGSHGVNLPKYRFLKWLYEYMISESGETYIVSSSIESLVRSLEKSIKFENKDWKLPVKKIYVYASEERKPIGEFTYKLYN
jgi:hypothetical protein